MSFIGLLLVLIGGSVLPKGHPVIGVVLSGRWACFVKDGPAAYGDGYPTQLRRYDGE